jgi:hypothetical protein
VTVDSVFPLRRRGKRPLRPWHEYQRRRATDDELNQWSRDPSLNAAIATGEISGIIVLDVDSDEAAVEVHRRGAPNTPTVQTARGHHYYFQHPGGTVRNFAGKLPGLDLRGDGGYVVAAGSVHPSGHAYRWQTSPTEAALAPPPGWLLELLRRPDPESPQRAGVRADDRYAERALDNELAALRRAAPGHRNDQLNRAAYNLGQLVGAGVLHRDSVMNHLLHAALATGLAEAEINSTLESGLASGMASPRVIPPAPIRPAPAGPHTRTVVAESSTFQLFDPITWDGREIPERRWMVPSWIPDETVVALYGDGGIGKSLLAQQLLTSAATGRPWLGLQVKRCRVLGLFCEDSNEELLRRQVSINRHLDLDFGDLEDLRWASRAGDDNMLMTFGADGVGTLTDLYHALRQRALELGVQLVVIDTLADTFAGNENIRSQVRQFIAGLHRLALDIGGAVVLCAHPSVAGLSGGSGLSGSTAWNNSVRTRLYLQKAESDDEPSANGERLLTRMKANYAEAGADFRLRWQDGVLTRIDEPGGVLASIERRTAEQMFMTLLPRWDRDPLGLTDSPKSPSRYAPAIMARVEGHRFKVKDLARAMMSLMANGTIQRVYVGPPSNGKTRLALSPQSSGEAPP